MDFGLGAMLGGALGGLFGSGDDEVTQRQELPSFLQPYAPLYAQMGYNLSQQPFNPYPFETVAPFTQDQNAAMDMVRQRSMAGSPVVNAAQQQTLNTINGDYLNPSTNPYLQQTFDQAANRVTDAFSRGTAAQTDARFARAGAFGGSAWNEMQGANQQALGDSLAGMAANIFGNNYAQERNRQQQASQFAPNLAAQDYRDAEALLNVGGMQQQLGQNYLTDDLSRFTQAQQYPYQQFAQFGQMFNPALGSQSTQTMPGVSPMAGALGGAMGGLGIYNAGQQAGVWGQPTGGGGLLGSATASTPIASMGGGTGLIAPPGVWGYGS
ncbi:MAG: hypothetical protein KJZ57_04020 [Anaerolineales bacterium]|nr:hypothetical protein [Anaerolineales bacterium]